LFGSKVFDQNDQLITSALARLAFSDETRLRQLNAIIHPLVLEDFLAWAGSHASETYILYESALLFESGFYRHFDHCILVSAPDEVAMKRVIERDGITEDEFMTRRARQMPEQEKIHLADHVIDNDGDRLLIPQVIALHHQFESPAS
jgi:dephospho-CoA kinase